MSWEDGNVIPDGFSFHMDEDTTTVTFYSFEVAGIGRYGLQILEWDN